MAIECRIEVNSGSQFDTRFLDALIAELASRQHGVVARWQLLDLGAGPRAIGYRLSRGRLHLVHRGVYAVGHSVLSVDARSIAAALAGGPGAVVSHRAAADRWAILRTARHAIEVTVPGPNRSRPGLQFHRARLPVDEVTILDGIPVTTVPRTLFDLAAVVPRRRVERALHEAEVQRLSDHLSLQGLLARHPGSRGVATIRAILADQDRGSTVTKEELEELFLAFLDREGLPRPETNRMVEIGGRLIEADCVWWDQQVIVELDGHHVHATRRNYEGDRSRDRALQAAEWRVVRITWRQLHDEAEAVAADLRVLLARSARAGERAA